MVCTLNVLLVVVIILCYTWGNESGWVHRYAPMCGSYLYMFIVIMAMACVVGHDSARDFVSTITQSIVQYLEAKFVKLWLASHIPASFLLHWRYMMQGSSWFNLHIWNCTEWLKKHNPFQSSLEDSDLEACGEHSCRSSPKPLTSPPQSHAPLTSKPSEVLDAI